MSFKGVEGQKLLAKIRAMQKEYNDMVEAERKKNQPPEYGDECEHQVLEDYDGVPVCQDCGTEFPGKTKYVRSMNEFEQFNSRRDSRYDGLIPDSELYNETSAELYQDSTPPKTKGRRKPKHTDQQKLIPESPKNMRDLRKMASARGIPKFNRMSKDELCKVLGVELEAKPDKFVFTDVGTGEEFRFHSIYRAAKEMGINPASVKYYSGREITIRGKVYSVREV